MFVYLFFVFRVFRQMGAEICVFRCVFRVFSVFTVKWPRKFESDLHSVGQWTDGARYSKKI